MNEKEIKSKLFMNKINLSIFAVNVNFINILFIFGSSYEKLRNYERQLRYQV